MGLRKKSSMTEKQTGLRLYRNKVQFGIFLETRGGFLFYLDRCIKVQVFASSFEVLWSAGLLRPSSCLAGPPLLVSREKGAPSLMVQPVQD